MRAPTPPTITHGSHLLASEGRDLFRKLYGLSYVRVGTNAVVRALSEDAALASKPTKRTRRLWRRTSRDERIAA